MNGSIPPLPQYAFMAWCLVKPRDNFTFTFIHLSLTQKQTHGKYGHATLLEVYPIFRCQTYNALICPALLLHGARAWGHAAKSHNRATDYPEQDSSDYGLKTKHSSTCRTEQQKFNEEIENTICKTLQAHYVTWQPGNRSIRQLLLQCALYIQETQGNTSLRNYNYKYKHVTNDTVATYNMGTPCKKSHDPPERLMLLNFHII
jgi:hypothetical protein